MTPIRSGRARTSRPTAGPYRKREQRWDKVADGRLGYGCDRREQREPGATRGQPAMSSQPPTGPPVAPDAPPPPPPAGPPPGAGPPPDEEERRRRKAAVVWWRTPLGIGIIG